MNRLCFLAFVIVVAACDGIGEPIVGERVMPDAAEPSCELAPACREVRAAAPDVLRIAPERLRPSPRLDCDADEIEDARDNCPGVPNPDQGASDCADAVLACIALANGQREMSGADLRGCRLSAPIAAEGLSLARADLSCSSLRIDAGDAPVALDLAGAILIGADLDFSAATSLAIDADRVRLTDAFVRLLGPIRWRSASAVLDRATLVVVASDEAGLLEASATVEMKTSDISDTLLVEEAPTDASRMRVERSALRATHVSAAAFELVGSTLIDSRLDVPELVVIDTELERAVVRSSHAAFAASLLRDAIFVNCEDLHFARSELLDVDIPRCPPDALRLVDSEVLGARFAGGLLVTRGRVASSVLGDGDGSAIRTDDAVFDAVRLCEPGDGVFRDGELRCVHCEATAFRSGEGVCLAGASVIQRGCQPIELAPECPF